MPQTQRPRGSSLPRLQPPSVPSALDPLAAHAHAGLVYYYDMSSFHPLGHYMLNNDKHATPFSDDANKWFLDTILMSLLLTVFVACYGSESDMKVFNGVAAVGLIAERAFFNMYLADELAAAKPPYGVGPKSMREGNLTGGLFILCHFVACLIPTDAKVKAN